MSVRVALTMLQCWHRVPGGTATAVVGLADALVARGDVEVVGVGPWGRSLPPAPFTPHVPLRRFHLPYQAVYDGWHLIGRPSVEALCGRGSGPPIDLVHATTTMVPPKGRRPLVVTVNDLFPLQNPAQFTPRGVRLFNRGIELARRHADIVICPSAATLEDCVDSGFARGRLRLVPWAVEMPPAGGDVEGVRARHGLARPYLLWVGTIEPRKNLTTLIAAYERLGAVDHDLVLVGPSGWDDAVENEVRAATDATSPERGRVRRLGFVDAVDLQALYEAAVVVCVPSLAEGFGLPALEAMAHGTPVVASLGTATEEVVGGAGVLVEPTDVDAWTSALRVVLTDSTLRARLGRDGVRRAREFSWERTAAATVDVYREVTA